MEWFNYQFFFKHRISSRTKCDDWYFCDLPFCHFKTHDYERQFRSFKWLTWQIYIWWEFFFKYFVEIITTFSLQI